jgi:hypothetical protein
MPSVFRKQSFLPWLAIQLYSKYAQGLPVNVITESYSMQRISDGQNSAIGGLTDEQMADASLEFSAVSVERPRIDAKRLPFKGRLALLW